MCIHEYARARARFIRSCRAYGLLPRRTCSIYNKSSSKSDLNSLSYTPMTALLCPHAAVQSSYVIWHYAYSVSTISIYFIVAAATVIRVTFKRNSRKVGICAGNIFTKLFEFYFRIRICVLITLKCIIELPISVYRHWNSVECVNLYRSLTGFFKCLSGN